MVFNGATPQKRIARRDTLLSAIEASGLKDFQYIGLCGRQVDHEDGELRTLVDGGYVTMQDYMGVDLEYGAVFANRTRFPEARFWDGHIDDAVRIHALRRSGLVVPDRPAVVYLDYMGLKEAFFAGPIKQAETKDAQTLIKERPGSLATCMGYLRPKDMVIVNVRTAGRGHDYAGMVANEWVPALLAERPGWKLRPFMSGTKRNLFLDKPVRRAKFYTYRSVHETKNTWTEFTSFALTYS